MKKKCAAAATALCMALLLCACASRNAQEHKTDAEEKLETQEVEVKEKEYQKKLDAIEPAAYRNVSGLALEAGSYISVIGKGSGTEFWEQVKKGASQAGKDLNAELGYEGKDKIKVTYSGPETAGSVDEQVNILDEELARYPVGLSISIADAKSCEVQFDLAASNGIPIVAFDSKSDYQGLAAAVSTDNKATAAMAADKMAEMLGETGNILVFIQDSKSESALSRESGFVEEIKANYPGITIAEVYYIDQLDDIKKEMVSGKEDEKPEDVPTEDVMDYIISKHPDVQGCFAADGDMAKLVVEALERAEKEKITVVGYDGNKDEIEALEKGKIDGLVIQNPFGMGYASVVAAARAALSIGNEAYVNTGAMWVTKDNLDSDEVKGWLY